MSNSGAAILGDAVSIKYFYTAMSDEALEVMEPKLSGGGVLFNFSRAYDVVVTDTQIIVKNFRFSGKFGEEFTGFTITDYTKGFKGYRIASASDLTGISYSNVLLNGSSIKVDFRDLQFTPSSTLVLDVY